MFVVATVFFAIEASTLGAQLAQLENEETNLIKKRQELSNQLVLPITILHEAPVPRAALPHAFGEVMRVHRPAIVC